MSGFHLNRAALVLAAAVLVIGAAQVLPGVSRAADAPKEKQQDQKPADVKAVKSAAFPGNQVYSRVASNGAGIDPDKGQYVRAADGRLEPFLASSAKDPEITLKGIASPKQFAVIQIPLDATQARDTIGVAAKGPANAQAISLEDASGKGGYSPTGYMVQEGAALKIKLDPVNKVGKASDVKPVPLKKDQVLYLVFHVSADFKPAKLVVGSKSLTVGE